MPNKFLGQHFLRNVSVIKKIVAAIDPQKNETIIEVGPGHGELTRPLAEACAVQGAKLIAIEKDKSLADELGVKERGPHIEIISSDVLEVLKSPFPNSDLPFKIVGNIPYYLTGHLLRIISELENRPLRCVFTVQKEVAERMCARSGRMNRLAASVQFWADAKIIASVPKKDFLPPPKVDSAVVVLDKNERLASIVNKKYFIAMRTVFSQPRKTILNNLVSREGGGDKEFIKKELEKIHIRPGSRPQDLSIEEIRAVARVFF
jgi:16S rRNA (adenine1518-N6/adenine1519-N6)-dimethyltransferase